MEYDPWRWERQPDGSIGIVALVCYETGDECVVFSFKTSDPEMDEEIADAIIAGHQLYRAQVFGRTAGEA